MGRNYRVNKVTGDVWSYGTIIRQGGYVNATHYSVTTARHQQKTDWTGCEVVVGVPVGTTDLVGWAERHPNMVLPPHSYPAVKVAPLGGWYGYVPPRLVFYRNALIPGAIIVRCTHTGREWRTNKWKTVCARLVERASLELP